MKRRIKHIMQMMTGMGFIMFFPATISGLLGGIYFFVMPITLGLQLGFILGLIGTLPKVVGDKK